MSTRSSVLVSALLVASVIGAAWSTSPPAAAEEPGPAALPTRYQMEVVPRPPSGGYSTVFLVDTATGECWYRSAAPDDKWTSIGSPAAGKR
ncbi:hypothetical protein [Planctomyces sp. SH-PL14]|uniref:hypothetical protein n=1 Tax=Planctomyces sp. SH-PL14 TaxID=1632864 RepID=UPI00078BADC9|nr:hypothetical protein [Planctomyces sp. SH-PL14]AMV22469.1 hypothetical protein VT03_31530 [Planctomyces sp. SH-PL14]